MALEPRPLARRAAAIQPFYVMELLARARALEAAGRDIVHMEVGEPDFPTPAPIVEAGVRALRGGLTRYTPATGLPALREAISAFYQQRYDLSIAPARIVVTPGASGALQLAVAALVEAGAQVLMADPGYPCNRHLVRLVEGEVESLPVRAEDGFQPTVAAVQSAWSARSAALLLASPANPTGTLMPAERLRTIVDVVHRAGGRVVVDEVYHALVYGIAPSSALAVSDELFVVNSFSKYFGMTGWRLGWLVAPPAYIPCLERLAQNLFLAAPTPAQHAALAAFEPDTLAILEQRRRVFQQRR
ncbi:MAG TPA: aminotransferase class I/II-fold pyridoxal phosphate-dependent enzyme, partial [Gammaproteobacteria bacterium]|nr:aminotransferase class I/II-fold pyridoxal phosphate-dependent enzyme [Gammaproteobacteria bacterium]